MAKNTLAIVIPAYKASFLQAALESIAKQTCMKFTLYIGDDCSPYDLKSIVELYKERIDLVYHRFDFNLGGKDLVAQWTRCVDMTQGEPYIWLFSDDDIMEDNCVDAFYTTLKLSGNKDLFHFNVKVIDDEGKVTRVPAAYPNKLDNLSFYAGKIRGKYMSLVVENIFSRSVYEKYGGFQKFDLAWGSDTATWIKFSEDDCFENILGAYVFWRSGTQNISPDLSAPIAMRKLFAIVDCYNWIFKYFKLKGKNCWLENIRGFISRAILFGKYVDRQKLFECVKKFCKGHECVLLFYPMLIFIKMRVK